MVIRSTTVNDVFLELVTRRVSVYFIQCIYIPLRNGFNFQVFFPMLSRLLEVTPIVDQFNLEETRVRASNLLCKV